MQTQTNSGFALIPFQVNAKPVAVASELKLPEREIIWKPLPGSQVLALDSRAHETL